MVWWLCFLDPVDGGVVSGGANQEIGVPGGYLGFLVLGDVSGFVGAFCQRHFIISGCTRVAS